MKIAVLGADAIGGIVAIGLHLSGHDVTVIDPWKPHVETIRTASRVFVWEFLFAPAPARFTILYGPEAEMSPVELLFSRGRSASGFQSRAWGAWP